MNSMMVGGGEAYKWLKHYNVTHITVPWGLRKSFNVEFLNAVGTRVTSNGRYTVFEIAREELDRPVVPCKGAGGAVLREEKACRAQGCMWLPQFMGERCQAPHGLDHGEPVEDCASSPDEGKRMNEDICHDKWCAWYPHFKGPWCQKSRHGKKRAQSGNPLQFHPMDILTPDRDCGWNGIDIQQCVDRGCTWAPAGVDPWCTYKGPNKKSAEFIASIEPM